jgi:hypothetical protein
MAESRGLHYLEQGVNMTTKDEALKKALKVLQSLPGFRADIDDAITDITEALAQPAQEPVCPACKAEVLYECVACSSNNYPAQPAQEPVALEDYDAGLLSDHGGGNVEWWQDYIRAELGRAYAHYQSQTTIPPAAQPAQDVVPQGVIAAMLHEGLTLVKDSQGYRLMRLGKVEAQANPPEAQKKVSAA